MNDLTPYGRPGLPGPVRQPPPQPGPSEADFVAAGNLRLAQRMATFFAVLIGVTSLFGLKLVMTGETALARWIIPLVAAPVLTLVLAAGWHILLGTASRPAHTRPLLSLIVAGGLGLTVIQVATTSWFLATAIGGGAAVQRHHAEALEPFKAVLAQLLARDERDRVVLGHLTRAQSELEALYACERSDGCVSGTPGSGRVARELAQEIEGFRRGAEELQRTLGRRPALLDQVRRQIERAQVASRAGDEGGFATAVNAAVSSLSSADAADPEQLLQALGSNSTIAEVQAVYARLGRSMERIGEFEEPLRLPGYQPMDRASAVIAYAADVPFAWAVAIAIDLLPLSLLLLVLLASYRGSAPEPHPIPYDYDYEELRVALEEADAEIEEAEEVDDEPAPPPRKTLRRGPGRPRGSRRA